jgi:hypothetical protein
MENKQDNQYNDKLSLFYNQDSFNLDINYGRHYYSTDTNFNILLYRANIIESVVDDFYGEAKPINKKFEQPIRVNIWISENASEEQKYLSDTGIIRQDVESFIFNIYEKELEENKIQINRGDVIEYNPSNRKRRLYEVVDANYINESINQTYGGFTTYYRRIVCIPVKEDFVLL